MSAHKKVFGTLQAGRGIAAFMVVVYHSGVILTLSKYWNYRGFSYTRFGYSGVEYFFVLSGIVILHAHWDDIGRPSALKGFFWKRFRRIYPMYWVVLFVLLPTYALFPSLGDGTARRLGPVLESIVLLPVVQRGNVLSTAWTLFHEIVFYLVFAIAIANRRAGIVALGLWLAASAICCFYTPVSIVVGTYISPLHLLFGFGLAATILIHTRTLPAWPLIVLGLGGFIVCATYDNLHQPSTVIWPLCFGLSSAVAAVGLMSLELKRKVDIPKFLIFLGDASYSLYLVHYAMLSVMAKVLYRIKFFTTTPIFLPFTILVITSTAAGLLIHIWIERPILKRIPR